VGRILLSAEAGSIRGESACERHLQYPTANAVTNSEQTVLLIRDRRGSVRTFTLATLGSRPEKAAGRGGTRIPCEIPVTLTSRDARDPFTQRCEIILANLGGCAARSPRPVPTGTVVHLQGLPNANEVAARVVNCISLGEFEKLWLLGLALQESGNVWGIESVPDDWQQ